MADYATTIYPAKAALDTLLRGWTWPDGAPLIAWGPPSEQEDTAFDAVYQGTTVVEEVPFPGLSTRNDEVYTLPIVADVRRYGDDEKATEQRAWSHVNEVLTLLRTNLELSGTVCRQTGYGVEVASQPSGANQWRTQIVVRVGVVGIVPA
jgi:hypothetical protein